MLKNLFGKNESDNVEIKEDWAPFLCEIEGKPASIRVNLALNQIIPIKGYKEQIWFSVKFMNPDENGLVTSEEFEVINAIEDSILENLQTKHKIVLAGAIKTNGRLDLYIYANSSKGAESLIDSAMYDNFINYLYTVDFKQDKNWEDYYKFLYPTPYELRTIQNQRVIMGLEQHGNNPEIKRQVDHWIDFKNQHDAKTFMGEIKSKGYEVLREQQSDQQGSSYSLNIGRQDTTIASEVNNYVWELVELANESNGRYQGWGCPIAT